LKVKIYSRGTTQSNQRNKKLKIKKTRQLHEKTQMTGQHEP